MRGDWIKLHRKALETPAFADDWLWRLWCWCLLKARYRAGKGLKSGQFVTGRFAGSEELGVSPSKFYRGLQKLAEFGQITIEADSRRTTVTVVKWQTYQADDRDERTAGEQPADSQRTAGEQPVNTIEEGKKERKEEGKKEERARFAPPTLDEVSAYCQERSNRVNPTAFLAYYESNGWRVGKNRMKDWRAAVRTWETNNYGRPTQSQASIYDPNAAGTF